MTNKEAIEILTQTQIFLGRRNGKKAFTEALLKAVAALVEKEEREQKAKALKEQHKNKCRYCENFSFGYGGLSTTLGHCAILDAPFTDNRKANNKACKNFVKDQDPLMIRLREEKDNDSK